MAFHPKYKDNGQLFIYYTTRSAPLTSVISRFTVSKNDPNKIDPKSEQEILRIPQPYWNHNGGTIAVQPPFNGGTTVLASVRERPRGVKRNWNQSDQTGSSFLLTHPSCELENKVRRVVSKFVSISRDWPGAGHCFKAFLTD